MLNDALIEIQDSELAAARRMGRERRLRGLVNALDGLIFELEELNLQGRDRVPARLRERSLKVLLEIPNGQELEVRHRTMALLDVLFDAQDRLLKLSYPERPEDHDAATA